MVLDVFGECTDGYVPLARRFLECLEQYRVEITLEYLCQLPWRGVTSVRHLHCEFQLTGAWRILLQDGVLKRPERLALRAKWPHSCEQLVEHNTQRVDI